MPAHRPSIGMGRRRQGSTEPDRSDDSNQSLERAIDEERALAARDNVFERGRQPGAHGQDGPHREVKPGTKRTIDDAGLGNADES